MTNEEIVERLKHSDLMNVNNLRLLFDMARTMDSLDECAFVRKHASKLAQNGDMEAYYLVRDTYLWAAPKNFDSYMVYMEWDRNPEARFYLPRRHQLMPFIRILQDMADDKLDEAFLSLPPRVGKTSLLLFFATWWCGRDPELSNLYSSYSSIVTTAFYNGILEVISDTKTYNFGDVFPGVSVVRTNASDTLVDLYREKHYPSLTCRSIDGTLNGAVDVKGLLIADDLVSGIEEAMSPDRLAKKWATVENNLLPRSVGDRKRYIWCGTRWSLIDPIGKRLNLLENNPTFKGVRYAVVNRPALDERDESNFDYKYGVGFSTIEYRRRRASFELNNDMASWMAQYMQQPIEREGMVFSPESMRYFNGVLPEGEPDRIFDVTDPAWGGGDYVASAMLYKYGDDLFLKDVIFDNRDKAVTQPRIGRMIIKHKAGAAQFEATKMTKSYAEGVEEYLKKHNYRCNVMTKVTTQTVGGKQQRIFDKAPDIRERIVFLSPGARSPEYQKFMTNVFSFKIIGNNKNDDAPDVLAMAIECDDRTGVKAVRVRPRLW